ncbi:hypothetical protein [Novosphingobium sp.]|uniref:hypothetical protein n=1 Tax=Novosphingobium sp. TaxID=1874826 RepID=UPI0031CDD52F
MGMISLFADGAALMIGSLLVAVLLTIAAWVAADKLHRRWVSLVLLGVVVAGLLVSPLEQSLFVRMVSVFLVVGGLLLSVTVLDRSEAPDEDVSARPARRLRPRPLHARTAHHGRITRRP